MRWGRAGTALFGVHVALLFVPPLPPLYKGSLWSYLLAYTAVALLSVDAAAAGVLARERWRRLSPPVRAGLGVGAVALLALVGSAVHGLSEELFLRFSREEGVWEPISLTCFVGSAALLFRTAHGATDAVARHLRLVGGGFVLLALEEIDYFGLIGGVVGRIDGIYAGSLHDLIRLAEARIVGSGTVVVAAAVSAALATVLYRSGHLQPRRLMATLLSAQGVWLLAGFGFLALGAAEEASLFGVDFPPPSPEELVESLGGLCLGVFAIELAADSVGSGDEQSDRGRARELQGV